ncbi:ATP-binding cassette domain-containing protein [Bacteroides sp. AN502(2024)]|uniref:ATP-binding cassette domain-containing protein n=1 Tax=Bacteroides sp. AN502(2024) TaxID=3160599 RepID=UPI0035137640
MALLEYLNIKVGIENFISIFGSVGSGKTTLTDLLQRNYVPSSGEILFKGTDIKNYQLSQWRSYLGIVPQYTKIFIGTVTDNITMFQSILVEDVLIFCKKLGLEQFLQDDNLSLYHILDENGNNLSRGQRQLIGIARALYKSPEILIIDESTASMDKVNEMQVLNLLQRLKNRMAILMITHKPEIA